MLKMCQSLMVLAGVAAGFAAGPACADVRINEVMAANDSALADEDGDYSDWIELLNTGAEAVSLGGWGLSDDATLPFKWTFPYLVLKPSVHVLVWASKKNRKPAGVLENSGLLIAEGGAWKYWDAGTVPAGAWRDGGFDDSAWPSGTARFGSTRSGTLIAGTVLATNAAGCFHPSYFFRRTFTLAAVPSTNEIGAVLLRHFCDDGAVVSINGTEVFRFKMPAGEVCYTNYTGDSYNVDYNGAWLTNTLDKALVLSLLRAGTNVCAVSLHQSKATTSDAFFDLGLRFQAGTNAALHTNFKVSASGCDLYLTAPGGTNADHVAVPVMPADYSAGRSPDGGEAWRVFPASTPGAANVGASCAGVVVQPVPSLAPGFYSNTVTLTLSTPTPDAAIFYTTDGSSPTTNSLRYAGPLTLTNRSPEPNALSLINTGNAGVINIPSFGVVSNYVTPTAVLPKARTVRAIAVKPDWKDAPAFGGTWFVGAQTGGYTLPVVSIQSDYSNFFGSTGILGNPSGANSYDWEYPVNVELFVGRAPVANQLMGIRIHGGFSSGLAEKTLRLYARADYGAASFDYPLFPDQPQYASYKRFLLRNGGNDWPRTLMRDALAQELCKHLRHDTQAYRPANLFLNGEYWGIHNIRERYDACYLERVYGVDPESVDLIGFPYNSSVAVADEGSPAAFNALLTWLSTNSLASAEAYATVTGQVDVANYMDYMLANLFVVNKDWPGNNIKFWRTRSPDASPGAACGRDGRWRWLMFDADFAFAGWDADPVSEDMWAWTTKTSGSGRVCEAANRLFRRLLENEGFRSEMLSRYADQLNTAYLPRRTRALAQLMRDAVWPDMQGHVDRWPGGIRSVAVWTNEVERVCAYARDRHGWEWRNMYTRFGLTTADVCVATSDIRLGLVRVNAVTVDATTLGLADPGAPYPWRGTYFRQLPVALQALPKSGCRFVRWAETGDTNPTLAVTLTNALLTLTAVFEPDPAVQAARAVFLPAGEENWDKAGCWSTGAFPDWAGAIAVIPPPTVPDADGLLRRNVRVNAEPVTVGHVEVENGGFNNRIRNKKDARPGSTLTFDGGGAPASLTVLGSDGGFASVEMTYGVVLDTDLRLIVSNTVGDAEYGALRLQAGWSGCGGLVKEGPGVCTVTGEGKAYAGRTQIKEGVLAFTQPAAPASGAGVAVEPGAQLRLTSGTAAGEPAREYAFGGGVMLASLGRTGFDGVPGAGAKGGLRYDPAGLTNRAVLLSPVTLSGPSGVHVDSASGEADACNALELAGALSGPGSLLKSGEGFLTISGEAAGLEGSVTVDDGTLRVLSDMRSADIVVSDGGARLTGSGRVGAITGDGLVSPGDGVGALTAQSVGGGLDFAFRFTASGEVTNGNDTLALAFTEAPFATVLGAANTVSVYFDALPPEDGCALGGFWTASPADFTRFVALADWRFFVADVAGEAVFEGRSYAPCDVALCIETAACGSGRVLKITRPSHGYAAWRAAQFSLAERTDPAVSGPLAKGADGVENLMRYALGVGRYDPLEGCLPVLVRSGAALVYSYRKLAAADSGLDYAVVTTDDLRGGAEAWRDVFEVDGLEVRLRGAEPADDPAVQIESVEIVPDAQVPARFFRLKVTEQ